MKKYRAMLLIFAMLLPCILVAAAGVMTDKVINSAVFAVGNIRKDVKRGSLDFRLPSFRKERGVLRVMGAVEKRAEACYNVRDRNKGDRNMKRNSAIDAVRAIACVAVLFIHCRFPAPAPQFMDALGRFAVPFFLMVSGFFVYRSEKKAALAAAGRHLRHTLWLTLGGTVLYAVSNTVRQLRAGAPAFSWLDSLLSAEGAFNFFIYNRAIFLSSVMYYLFALIYVYVIFWALLKCNAVRHAEKLIPVLLGACVVMSEFMGLKWYYSGNFLMTGLPFFLLGHYFARKGKTYPRAKHFILPGVALTLLEAVFFHNDVYCYIGTLVTSISLFLACLHERDVKVPEGLAWFGRKCSVYVFLIHCAVRDQLYPWIPERPEAYLWVRPLVVLAASCILSIGCAFLHEKLQKMHKSRQTCPFWCQNRH